MSEHEMPVLTLDPFGENAKEESKEEAIREVATIEETTLTEEEKKMVETFSKQIDIKNANMVLQYGAEAQKKMSDFSVGALDNIKTKDLGEVGDMLSNLMVELKGFEVTEEENKGLFARFKKSSNRLTALTAKYNKAEVNVDKIVTVLEDHQVQLFKDIAVLDKLYDRNLLNFKELTMYIIAGKKRLGEVRETELKELMDRAKQTNLPEDAQAANDLANLCDRFEKKIHDLELTRVVSIQMAPQIRLVQNNDTLMAEKIQSTIVNTIPLWRSQMVLALGLAHSGQALAAQREVTNMTNELLKKNADALKLGTVETARESERGIVDIETLKYTNEQLLSTLDEVVQIQQEGKEKRRAAEQELGRLENEIKQKLLDIRN